MGGFMKEYKHLSLRIDEEMLRKFRYVCKYEGRSANRQLLIYIRDAIGAFEKEHGPIEPEQTEP